MRSILFTLLLGCESMKDTDSECLDCDTAELDTGTEDTDNTDDTGEDTNDTDTNDTDTNIDPTIDADGDGFSIEEGDCDDDNTDINPSEDESCGDGLDNNCDGLIDDASAVDSVQWFEDGDGDGFGNPDAYGQACEAPDGFVSDSTDCDDTDAEIFPGAAEIWYDDIDQDCDPSTEYDADADGNDDRMVDLSNAPQYIMELYTIGNSNGNVIQGIAIDFENRQLWASQDTSSSTENVLINQLSLESGNPQYCHEYTEGNNVALGHGQDLSMETLSGGQVRLWTGSESDRGVTRVDPANQTIESIQNLVPSGWSHSTPTIGLSGDWVAVRASKDGDSVNNDWIRIYEKVDIEAGFSNGIAPSPIYEFNIAAAQRVEDMWFQGIAVDEELGHIYALTGDNSLTQTEKLLYVYDTAGNVVNSTTIGMDWSTADALGSKYEPEGLSLVKDPNGHERMLYFTMMFGYSGNNIKRLYTIAPSGFDVGGSNSNSNLDWMIRYNNSNGDVSISTVHPDGDIGCETKSSTWSTGWTSFAGYFVNGDPHLMIQKEVGGTAKIHPLDWTADLQSATKDSNWSNGWSHLDTWEHGGDTYLFHYKSGASSTGLMRVAELTNGGNTDCCSEDEYWSTGWDPHIITMSNGDDYLFRYHTSSNQVRIAPLGPGTLGSDVYNNTWSSGYYAFDSLSIGGNTHLFALDSSGTVHQFDIGTNGVPTDGSAPSHSMSTSITDWDLLQAYTLEGIPMVRLYRSSDGFFQVFGMDANGQLNDLLNGSFDQMGWTSIHHFQTAQP